jgi:hypothetical protein
MIRKEFNCATCGDFESGLPRCPKCGEQATRVFRTPVGLGFGKAKSIDRVINGEFARRSISNYTNAGGRPVVNYGTGDYNGIKAGWGKGQLANIQQQYSPMQPLTPPQLPGGRANLAVPHVDMSQQAPPHQAWGGNVPTERMDLTPNE